MWKRLIVFFLMIWMAAACARGEEIYFRVVSRNDSAAAQEEKYLVRDSVLMLLEREKKHPAEMLPLINEICADIAPCRAQMLLWGTESREKRLTLYITIGEGEGPNWWGILYPESLEFLGEETEDKEITFTWPLIGRLLNWLGIK